MSIKQVEFWVIVSLGETERTVLGPLVSSGKKSLFPFLSPEVSENVWIRGSSSNLKNNSFLFNHESRFSEKFDEESTAFFFS